MSKPRSDILPMPEKIKTPHEELQVLAEMSNSQYLIVLKRVARRYTENLKTQSFTLREEDPHFAVKHARYVEQAVGMNLLIKIIEGAQAELNKIEGGENGK